MTTKAIIADFAVMKTCPCGEMKCVHCEYKWQGHRSDSHCPKCGNPTNVPLNKYDEQSDD